MSTVSEQTTPAGTLNYGNPAYGITRRVTGLAFEAAVAAVREALATEGFGVLTEIDVTKTLKAKLGVDFPRYLILGACNPPLAHQALSAEPGAGLLLPCNVVVADESGGVIVVSAADPEHLFAIVGREDVRPMAQEVGRRLRRALDRLPAAP